jgi:hypothetical protein
MNTNRGDGQFQPPVLVLEGSQPLRVAEFHSTVLTFPPVEALLVPSAQFPRRRPGPLCQHE